MNLSAPWQKSIVIIVIVTAILLPLVLLALSQPMIRSLLPFSTPKERAPQEGDRFTVVNKDPDFTISLVDISYLEYISAKLKLFDAQAIVDPAYYMGDRTATQRHTITHVRFELVPLLLPPMVQLFGDSSITGKLQSPWGVMRYTIEGMTLVVQVVLDTKMLTKEVFAAKFNTTDKFMTLAVLGLYYAAATDENIQDSTKMYFVTMDIKNHLYSGIIPWSFSVK